MIRKEKVTLGRKEEGVKGTQTSQSSEEELVRKDYHTEQGNDTHNTGCNSYTVPLILPMYSTR